MPTILLLNEENQSLQGKEFKIPEKILKVLQNNANLINNIYDDKGNNSFKKSLGYKRNQRLLNHNYNNKNSNKDNQNNSISYGELKRWKHDFDHMNNKNEKNISYQLNGGSDAENFVNNTLNQARNSVKQVNQVKKSENIQKSKLKPKNKPMKPIKMDNGSILRIK